MSPIGGGKPLFDLISSGRRQGDARPSPDRSPPPDDRDRIGREIAVPMIWIYAGVALLLVLVIGGFSIGYRLGNGTSREAQRQEAQRDAQSVFIEDPLREDRTDGVDSQGRAGFVADPGDLGRGIGLGASDPARASGQTRTVLLSDGRPGPDPRRTGFNYLELVSLPRDRAIEAVRYLVDNGEETIAVPADPRALDSGRRAPDTSDSFRIIALGLAVPGDRYKSTTEARERFETRLRRLGKAWSDAGGVSDFSDPLWRRFDG